MSTEGLRCDVCGGVWQPASSEERCPFCETSRLLAIIDKHPQLGDGMPVAIDMDVWFALELQAGTVTVVKKMEHGVKLLVHTAFGEGIWLNADDCYFTREAAETAKDST